MFYPVKWAATVCLQWDDKRGGKVNMQSLRVVNTVFFNLEKIQYDADRTLSNNLLENREETNRL